MIAIESEREFGLSVLERLDCELKRRGDLFRQLGVQDLKGYRDAKPDAVMPRMLLIIDEFQEFFVKDDKIAQDAALLLDRLVRQGRAFGIHVLLGSQTLAGAYSLARSTLGQMAVRIALQCSEADAHLILSDDNTAARLLSRPGEAIYNDANGLFEGNHPFQVVWLPDHEREQYLERVAELAVQRQLRTASRRSCSRATCRPMPPRTTLLRACLESPRRRGQPRWRRGPGWATAVAIKDPAAAVVPPPERQQPAARRAAGAAGPGHPGQLPDQPGGGTDVLLGRRADGRHRRRRPPRFYVLDGQRLESPTAGFWKRLARQLPLDVTVVADGGRGAGHRRSGSGSRAAAGRARRRRPARSSC